MKNINIRIFPNEEYNQECESIIDKSSLLLKDKKDEAYLKNPNITPDELEKIRIRPFGSNSKFMLPEGLAPNQDYTWNFWVGKDDNGKLYFTLQSKKAFVKDGSYTPNNKNNQQNQTVAQKMQQSEGFIDDVL